MVTAIRTAEGSRVEPSSGHELVRAARMVRDLLRPGAKAVMLDEGGQAGGSHNAGGWRKACLWAGRPGVRGLFAESGGPVLRPAVYGGEVFEDVHGCSPSVSEELVHPLL